VRAIFCGVVVCAFLCTGMQARAQPSCAPNVVGVQGGSPPGGPDFYKPTPVAPFGTRMTDPRWVGSSAVSYEDGTGHIADFRALVDTSSGSPVLLLSWRFVAGVSTPTQATDRIIFGYANGRPGTANLTGAMYTLVPKTTQIGNAAADQANPLVTAYDVANNGGATINNSPPLLPSAWVWTDAGVTTDVKVWGIEATFPLPSATTPFSFFFEMLGNVGGTPHVPLVYPSTVTISNPYTTPTPTQISTWAEVDPGSGCSAGVSLQPTDIGILHGGINTAQFNPGDGGNDVYAQPLNGTTGQINAGQLHAAFRLAEWGAQIGDSPAWKTIPGGGDVVNPANIGVGNKGQIKFNYVLTPQDNCDFFNFDCAGLTRTPRNADQCVQVELSGGNLQFAKASAGTNMQFVSASTYEGSPVLSVESSHGKPDFDVYFLIETLSMPATVSPETEPLFSSDPKTRSERNAEARALLGEEEEQRRQRAPADPTEEQRRALLEYMADKGVRQVVVGQQQLSLESLGMPTFKVHVYQDAGTRTRLSDGTESIDLKPGVGFGYFTRHNDGLSGWRAEMVAAGAKQVAPNVYRLHVGRHHHGPLKTRIEALEPGTSPPRRDYLWLWIVLGVLLFVIVVVIVLRREVL
jgi:hypothetical protein